MSDFSDVFGANPGVSLTTNRTTGLGNLNNDGRGLPVLLRDRARLGAPSFPSTLKYPFTEVITGDLNVFDPEPADAVLAVVDRERRPQGIARHRHRRSLRRHPPPAGLDRPTTTTRSTSSRTDSSTSSAARRPTSRRTSRRPRQHVRLHRCGRARYRCRSSSHTTTALPSSRAGNTGGVRREQLDQLHLPGLPRRQQPGAVLAGLDQRHQRADRQLDVPRPTPLAAGLPANFFIANPDLLGGVNVTGNGGYTRYDCLQIERAQAAVARLPDGRELRLSARLTRRTRYSLRLPRYKTLQTGDLGGVTHAFKGNWIFELPFGHDRQVAEHQQRHPRRGSSAAGSSTASSRVQSGSLVDYGNVRLVGHERRRSCRRKSASTPTR